jgi:hypothetical protein
LGDLLSKQPVAAASLTIAALAAAIARNPEDAQSLNNMAWLLATCPDADCAIPAERSSYAGMPPRIPAQNPIGPEGQFLSNGSAGLSGSPLL